MKRKFTLIELIIVIVVIGILVAMALPKFSGVIRNAKLSAMINDTEVLEKTMILYYQKYDKLPLLNEDQDLIVLNNDISLIKMVQAEEVVSEDMRTIYTSLQETLKHYNDSEENLYRIDISKVKNGLSKKLKYGYKEEDKDFYVYSTKTNSVYYYDAMINGDGEIYHSEFNTKLKESKLIDKKESYILNEKGNIIERKPILELITDLDSIKIDTIIKWEYSFISKNNLTKISFILNGIEYDDFDKIPTQLEENDYILKFKIQDDKGNWSNEVVKSFKSINTRNIVAKNLYMDESYSMKIGEDGKLYSWGPNYFGRLGIGDKGTQLIPQEVVFPNGDKPKSVYLNALYAVSLCENGNIYTWGKNGDGELGIGNTIDKSTPQKVEIPNEEKVISVSSSSYNTLVLTDKNNLYSWGNNDYGRLGVGTSTNESIPKKVNLPSGEKPVSINVNNFFTMVVTENGNLYAWGENNYGQLGIGNNINQIKPQKVTIPNGEKPYLIQTNNSTTMIVTDKGNLYSCGYNFYGQLGIGNTINQSTFQKVTVPNGEKPITISLGNSYAMIITNEGNLYSWGGNDYGQLGIGNRIKQTTPQKVNVPNGEKAVFIKLTPYSYSTRILTNKGNMYSCGKNEQGTLGLGEQLDYIILQKILIPNDEKIISYTLSNVSSIVLTDKKNIYTWGFNSYDHLATGSNTHKYLPIKINSI